MKKTLIIIFFLQFIYNATVVAQELNCNVSIATPKIQGTNKQVFETMQKSFFEFMNFRQWTNFDFQEQERIECNILITIDEVSGNTYKGSIQVQSRRPVFNSSYSSTMLNVFDKNLEFSYYEYQPLEFNENSFLSNITSVLAYYAYIIIGMDFDSFTPNGGAKYFEKAMQIVNNAQTASEQGWKSMESKKNRYWLIENLQNNTFAPFRTCMYEYHRNGLDVMHDDVQKGRMAIKRAIDMLKDVFRSKPNSYLLQLFFDVKKSELINIFSKAPQTEKATIVESLSYMDPANASEYRKILRQ